jgi:anti-sigma factor RsiW
VLDVLDEYLDGELVATEAARVRRHVEGEAAAGGDEGCALCRRELRRAELLRAALRALPEERCPDAVVERVRELALEESTGPSKVLPWRGSAAARWLRLGGLAAAAAALLWLGVRSSGTPAPRAVAVQAQHEYSAEELARAEEELRLALGYVAAIGRRSGVALRDEVLVGEVLEPSADALERAFGASFDTSDP